VRNKYNSCNFDKQIGDPDSKAYSVEELTLDQRGCSIYCHNWGLEWICCWWMDNYKNPTTSFENC